EDDRTAELLVKDVLRAILLEVSPSQLGRDVLDVLGGVATEPRLIQCVLVHVRGVDLHSRPKALDAELLGQQDRERVGLLAGRGAGAPHADQTIGRRALDDLRDDLLAEVLPGGEIAVEARDVDQDRVEQESELFRVDLEIVDVVGEARDVDRLHPLENPAHQARALVGREVEPARALQVVEERLEFRRGLRDHSASPAVTRVTRAEGISIRGRMKSTLPVWIAAFGMLKNSLVASSCAMTVPPIFLIA